MMTLSRLIADLQVTPVGGYYEVAVPLSEQIFEELMMFVVRQQVALADCDILMLLSQPDEVHTVPSTVNQLLKHIDCRLSVQFSR
jgi:folate-binding Fe-S cluster repair protein YgfZ